MRECVIVWWVVLGMAHGATLARNAADTLVATLVATPALFVSVTAIVIIGPRRTSAAATKEGINARLVRPVTLDVIFIWYCTRLERAPSAAKHMSCFCASCDSRSSAGGLHAAFIESDSFEHDLHWARVVALIHSLTTENLSENLPKLSETEARGAREPEIRRISRCM